MFDIVYSSDNNYIKYAEVSIVSLLENNCESNIYIHILCLNVQQSSKQRIQKIVSYYKNAKIFFYDIKESDFTRFKDISTYPGITLPTYFRLHLSSILTSVDKALYLDGDTIINDSLNQLFDIDISDYCLAGVPDINTSSFESIHKKHTLAYGSYINAGVVLFNLKKIRTEQFETKVDTFVANNSNEIKFGDQDILNLFYANKILILPDIYNVHGTDYFNRNTYEKPTIIHHVCKAWVLGQKTYYQNKYFKYLRLTSGAFKNKNQELTWIFKTNVIAFYKLITNPRHLFSFEYLYGIYKCTFRRVIKRK